MLIFYVLIRRTWKAFFDAFRWWSRPSSSRCRRCRTSRSQKRLATKPACLISLNIFHDEFFYTIFRLNYSDVHFQIPESIQKFFILILFLTKILMFFFSFFRGKESWRERRTRIRRGHGLRLVRLRSFQFSFYMYKLFLWNKTCIILQKKTFYFKFNNHTKIYPSIHTVITAVIYLTNWS